MFFSNRVRSMVHRRVMDRAVTGTRGFEIHPMVTIVQIVQTPNHLGSVIDPISRKAPTYRKFVKRREKTETTRCQGRSIRVRNFFIVGFDIYLVKSLSVDFCGFYVSSCIFNNKYLIYNYRKRLRY